MYASIEAQIHTHQCYIKSFSYKQNSFFREKSVCVIHKTYRFITLCPNPIPPTPYTNTHTEAVWCPLMAEFDCFEDILVSLCPPCSHPPFFSLSPFHNFNKGNSVILFLYSPYPSAHCYNMPLLSDRLVFMCWCTGPSDFEEVTD